MTRSIRRTKPARVAAAALSSVALLTTLSACGGSATGQEADALSEVSLVFGGALTVCTDSPYAPFVYEEKGKLVGFDVDLGQGQAAEVHGHRRVGLGRHGGEVVHALGLVGDECLGAQRVDLRDRADERRLADAEAAGNDDLRRRSRTLCLSSFEVHGGSFR